MPVARYQLEDGRIARFEVPDGTTPEQAQQIGADYFAQQSAEPAATPEPQQPQGNPGGIPDEIWNAMPEGERNRMMVDPPPSVADQQQFVRGVPGAAGTMATGIAGQAAGGLAGLASIPTYAAGITETPPGDVVENVVGALTNTPGEDAAFTLEAIGKGLEPSVGLVGKGIDATADAAYEATGSPLVGAAIKTAPEAIAAYFGVRSPKAMFGKPTPAKEKIAEIVAKNADDAQTRAFTLAPDVKATSDDVVKMVESGSDDVRRSRYTTQQSEAGPVAVKVKAAKEAIKQGMDEGTVSLIQSATPADKQLMRNALDHLKRGRMSKTYAVTNRPGDAAGGAVKARYDAVKRINQQASGEINKAATALEGRPVDVTPAYGGFLDNLQDLGVSITRDPKTGKLKGSYQDSEFAMSKGTQRVLNDFIARSEKGTLDAMDAHRLKRVIDGAVEYGKKSTNDPILGKAETALKGLRRGINERLQELSPEYRDANAKFADTRQALDAFHDAAGPSFNPASENAAKQLVNTTRSLMSNNQKRIPAMDAINALQESAKKYGVKFDDDILKQAAFMDDLETLFGSSAPTSFLGQIEKATGPLESAIRGDRTGAAIGVAKEGIRKARGINEENLMKALEELLSDNKTI